MNVAQSIVKMLESLGVDAIFTGSGQGSGDILFAFAESEKIRTIMTRHEQAASFMAYGYAMTSGKLGVCNAQGGPGSYNFFSGLGMAYTGSFPVMSIASYSPRKWRGMGDLGEVTGQNRTPNSQAMFSGTTKKTFLIERPEQACDLFEEAVNLAYEGRPGPVHIDLPYDVAATETKYHRDIHVNVKPVLPQDKDIRIFAEYLDQAIRAKKRVIAYFGYGCVHSGAGAELLEFVERFQLPFITTMDAKGVIADNHPLSIGMGGTCGDMGARQALKEAEVVLAVGCSFAKWQSWRFQEDIFDDKVLMHINLDAHEIGKVFKADFSMVSDAKPAMRKLTDALASRISVTEKASPVIDRHCFQTIAYEGAKVHPGQLSQQLGQLLPDNALVLGDAGAHMIWMAAYMQLNGGQTFKNPGSFGPMASHTNASIGAQMAAPGRRVIVGCGDGCYQMAGFELMTAVQNRIPVIWVIYNNSEFNIIKLFNLVAHGKEVFNHLLGPDFAEYAKLCGANGFRVDRLEQFEPAFKAALASDMPSVINVITDEQCVMPFKFYDQE
ncbi:MAG: thiamine pyrophosphate-binding protein [Geobacteraceae bacterium]|nr:thiamine pyrophosphate-binding protein [Geobacteraceae bacterium]